MAYAVGSGATTADFMDALRSFAAGLGWTVNRFDTTARRLYMEKDACHICFSWKSYNVTSYDSGSAQTIAEGIVQFALCASFGTGDAYNTFPGVVSKDALSTSLSTMGGNYQSLMSYMQGPFTQWFLFSDDDGSYIHAIVQVAADRYRWLTFGNVDKGGLSHSGAAYAASDGGNYWYRSSGSNELNYADPRYSASGRFDTTGTRFATNSFQVFSIDALPSTFDNGVACGSYNYNSSTSTVNTLQHPLRLSTNAWYSSIFPYKDSSSGGTELIDHVMASRGADWNLNVPMLGLPLIVVNSANTQACCIGAVPDFRAINLEGMSPQQEFNIGSDVWKVFPTLRQAPWSESRVLGNPTSGQYGWAIKKIS